MWMRARTEEYWSSVTKAPYGSREFIEPQTKSPIYTVRFDSIPYHPLD